MIQGCKKVFAMVMSVCLLVAAMGTTAFAENPQNAAKIGSQEYATLDEAILAANEGETIDLLTDCTTSGINLTKNLIIKGSEKKETITFTQCGIAMWKKSLTFENCNVVMNEIGSTPYTAEWNWMTICSNGNSVLNLINSTMTLDGKGFDKHAIYFGANDVLNLTDSTLAIKNYKQDALEWNGGNGGYNVNLTNSKFISDTNRSGFTGTFIAKIANSQVDVINSLGNGSNGSHFEIADSTVNFNHNTGHGLSAGNLTIHHSVVNANGNGANGIHVTGKLDIDNQATVTIENNDCSISSKWTIPGALFIAGEAKIANSTVTIQNNNGSGIYQKSGFLEVESSAKLTIVKNTAVKLGFGGGIYVNGTMVLADNVVLYNNHAATAGDDIYNLCELVFGDVGSDWALDGEPDCEHAIDGWYDDAEDARWNAHAEKDDDLHIVRFSVEGDAMASALKAAHGLITYTVTVNYLDKATGEKIGDSFITEKARENTVYDVTERNKIAFEGYDYDSTSGDLLTGTLDGNKVINVYYVETEIIEDSSAPLVGPSSTVSEKTIPDNELPATGGKTMIPVAGGLMIVSMIGVCIFLTKKRQNNETM